MAHWASTAKTTRIFDVSSVEQALRKVRLVTDLTRGYIIKIGHLSLKNENDTFESHKNENDHYLSHLDRRTTLSQNLRSTGHCLPY
jgi:hypothetical protein